MSYGMTIRVPGTVESTVDRVRAALREQGFGVLTEIDVQAALRQKLGAATARLRAALDALTT